uniref:Uncharacterized protein n=1 Tax=Biomphalaria glabrata TaxID=6526 RepID=A0A2C9LED5_BIOGL
MSYISGGLLIGGHETQESEGGEADLHKHRAGCWKSFGHFNFQPIYRFHLPPSHFDANLYFLVKAVADLTVRVSVKIASQHRPKVWPNTIHAYPFSNQSETRTLRTGSGRVSSIQRFEVDSRLDGSNNKTEYTKCWCRKCQDSESPSKVWWEFNVNTVSHLVFDDIEASHTTLRIFYDKDDSPVVSVYTVKVENVNVFDDFCQLKCVTCDKDLASTLGLMLSRYECQKHNVYYQNKNSRDDKKLNFIVSHPHGCPKQVSFGQWKNKHMFGGKCIFTYTTATCPGSSGAHVQCVGYKSQLSWSDLVHSRCLGFGFNSLNCSGAAIVDLF